MGKLDSANIRPLYLQLADLIRKELQSQNVQYGEKIPTEIELSQKYNVGRNTVRSAINILVDEDILEKKQGKGTFVKFPVHYEKPSYTGSFTKSVENSLSVPTTEIIEKKIILAPEPVEEALNLAPEEKIIYLLRLRKVDGVPAILEEDFFPPSFEFLLSIDLENQSIFQLITDRLNIRLDNSNILYEAILATQKHSQCLGITDGQPLLIARQTVFSQDQPIYYNIQYIRSEVYKTTVKTLITME